MWRASALLVVASIFVGAPIADAATLREESARGRTVVKRWALSGTPKGVATAESDTIYVGLAERYARGLGPDLAPAR